MIAWTIYITFGAAAVLLFAPRLLARWLALLAALAGFAIGSWEFFRAADLGTLTTIVRIPWLPMLGMEYHLAADGISLTLVLVTGLTAVSAATYTSHLAAAIKSGGADLAINVAVGKNLWIS